jgi:hypothetical protein
MTLSKKEHLVEAKKIYKKTNSAKKVCTILCEKYGVENTLNRQRLVRKWFKDELKEDKVFKEAQLRYHNEFKKYTIITSAQNATPINSDVWDSVLLYANKWNARIEVIPLRYKNPTSQFTGKQSKQEWWDKTISKFMVANRHKIHENLVVLGDVKTQLTASMPLSAMEGLTGSETAIIGHPRQHMKTTPRLDGQRMKFMASSGVVTKPNYTDSKSGKKGEFHHTYGFIMVEDLGQGSFNFRQVSIDEDGTFYDLDYEVKDGSVTQKHCVEAVVLGDLHLGEATCQTTLKTSYEMLNRFKPKHTMLHDVMDGYVINPHELKDPFILAKNEMLGKTSIKSEIKEVLSFIKSILEYNPVVVKSNHDVFVDRFLMNDWRKGTAKHDYLEYAYLKSKGELPNGILPYEVFKEFGSAVTCLNENSSYKVCGVELGQHGHLGVSGSRGSVTQFKRLNTKIITAHTHAPTKEDGAMCVGTNTELYQPYTKGLSKWWNSNAIVHINGKAQNLLIFEGEYTTI